MPDPDARRVALRLLAQGLARPHEVADRAGVSLQVVQYWIGCAELNWRQVRDKRVSDSWQKEMRRGPRLVEAKKARKHSR